MTPCFTARRLLALIVACLALGAHAQEAVIRKAIGERFPEIKTIDEISKSSIPGIYELRVNGSEIYYSDASGDHLLVGSLYDTRQHRNLTEERIDKLTAVKFDALPFNDAFTIVRGTGARKLAVFEDPNCGYCRRFEHDLQKVDNVTVYLFLYPILGGDSPEKSLAVWCAKDRSQVWLDWMLRGQSIPNNPNAMCDPTAIKRNVEFGRTYHVNGTPTLIFQDGRKIPGAIDAKQVEKHLADAKS